MLKIRNTSDQVRIDSYFGANGTNGWQIEEIRFEDAPGVVWDYAHTSAVIANNAPTLSSLLADQSVIAGSPFTWSVPANSFTDADASDQLTYAARLKNGDSLPSWLTFNAATLQFVGAPGAADVGLMQIQIIATDQLGSSVSDVFALHVRPSQTAVLRGTSSADTLTGSNGDEVILGLAGNDVLSGGAGNDTLDGGIGADAMSGGSGDDVYIVDNTSDTVAENASEGIDTVESSVSFTLGANVENLTLTGSAAINGAGNSLANTLLGNDAANTLNGGTGADTMSGGLGDDIYIVDNASDSVIEGVDGGVDLIRSSVTRTLGANIENLTLTGNTAISGTGNGLANVLTGNTSANTLTGYGGNDTLIGGKGWDVLVGGEGHDVYLLSRGDSTDAIVETGSSSTNQDTARFGADIAADQLWFRQVNNNLEVSVIGTSDKFSVVNWYVGTQYRVERFESGNDLALTSGQVQNLVNAMASFAPPAAGQTTLPADYAATLNPVIAANWQ
ncbi:putative Ig domain-containing protein [Pseudorhodoferax sp. Leaf265]|uniref:putative Ig domain-containing protein n=1 Tax=Pseudorhodoferax sp. Leaf265 TaxID=1736315 RepID=UPI0035108EB2